MLHRLGIPYKQALRAGCPALVDSHANTVKLASSNPVAARVFLHNRFIALIHYCHVCPGKSLSSYQNMQMRQNRMERREVANLCRCLGWGSGYKRGASWLGCIIHQYLCKFLRQSLRFWQSDRARRHILNFMTVQSIALIEKPVERFQFWTHPQAFSVIAVSLTVTASETAIWCVQVFYHKAAKYQQKTWTSLTLLQCR